MESYRPIYFEEDGILIKTLSGERERRQAYQLRHQVFAQRLKWVPVAANGQEIDHYDLWATSVGLFVTPERMVGVFRMLPTEGPFMLEREFRAVLPPEVPLRRQPDTTEITRLALDPSITDRGLSSRLMLILFKGVYQWSVANRVRNLYMVIEKRFLRVLRTLGFPCEALSAGVTLPPANALSVPALLDWERFRMEGREKRPSFLEWMQATTVGQTALAAASAGQQRHLTLAAAIGAGSEQMQVAPSLERGLVTA